MGRPSNIVRRRRMMRLQRGRCYYCGRKMIMTPNQPNTVTIEHRKPRWRHGRSTGANIVGACAVCNTRKGGLTEQEYQAQRDRRQTG